MKEKYLHYLWKNKLLPFHQLQLSNESDFKVIYQGDYNEYESGPDFLNAKLEINGITWIGNVEIHVKSSDWNVHGHQNDRAYDNVILHVVYDYNCDIFQNGNLIPTLQLKQVISFDHYKKYQTLFKNKNTILCGTQLQNIDPFYIISLYEKALYKRMFRKTENLVELTGSTEPKQVLYFLLARAMGSKINQLPFEELTHRLPLELLKRQRKSTQKEFIQLTSGFAQPDSVSELLNFPKILKGFSKVSNGTVSRNSWKFGGTRPGNSPDKRVEQFAVIVEKFDFEVSFIYLSITELYAYILELLTIVEGKKLSVSKVKDLTISFKQQLIINCFAPFIFWYGQQRNDDVFIEKSFEILRLLTPEKNSVMEKWKKFGIVPRNAAESQSLLEIFNEFCSKKKCLSCDIGIQLLNK